MSGTAKALFEATDSGKQARNAVRSSGPPERFAQRSTGEGATVAIASWGAFSAAHDFPGRSGIKEIRRPGCVSMVDVVANEDAQHLRGAQVSSAARVDEPPSRIRLDSYAHTGLFQHVHPRELLHGTE